MSRALSSFVEDADTEVLRGRVLLVYSAIMADVPHYWTADQVGRLLDALAAHNRYEARTAALIMWRTGLRISECLELEWRDLDYSGEPATLPGSEVEDPSCLEP